MSQAIEKPRRLPSQPRARQTYEAILDAAAQILRTRGENCLTTNHIAERAGVSVGTLYQYFKNKDMILLRLSDREVLRLRERIGDVLGDAGAEPLETSTRRLVRSLIQFFARRRHSRRVLLLNLLLVLANGKPDAMLRDTLAELSPLLNQGRLAAAPMDDTTMFVMVHALLGVLRSAMVLRPALLESAELEDRLVQLILVYLQPAAT